MAADNQQGKESMITDARGKIMNALMQVMEYDPAPDEVEAYNRLKATALENLKRFDDAVQKMQDVKQKSDDQMEKLGLGPGTMDEAKEHIEKQIIDKAMDQQPTCQFVTFAQGIESLFGHKSETWKGFLKHLSPKDGDEIEADLAGIDEADFPKLMPYILIELTDRGIFPGPPAGEPVKGKGQQLKGIIKAARKRQQDGQGKNPYSLILQGKGTNEITHSSKRRMTRSNGIDRYSGNGEIVISNVRITLENAAKYRLDVTTHQVLDALVMKLTKALPQKKNATEISIDENRLVSITVAEFKERRGLSDYGTAYRQLEAGIKTLYNLSIKFYAQAYDEKGKKTGLKPFQMRIAELTSDFDADREKIIDNGTAYFKFAYDLAKYLVKAKVMPYPENLSIINSKQNPHAYYIGRKLAEYHNMNIADPNSGRISVKALAAACPDLPEYGEVMNTAGKNVTQQIIQPLERDLEALKEKYGILASWEYCNSKGTPLTDEQLEKYNYSTWIQWLVQFELANYPDKTELIKKITDGRKAAGEAKKKRQSRGKGKGKGQDPETGKPVKE